MKRLMGISRLFAAALWIAMGLSAVATGQAPTKAPVPEFLHKPAPELARTDLSGGKIDLKSYRGKVVLLNFWATWCAPCQLELPEFETWQKKYGGEGLQILAVSMDDGDAPVRRTVRRLKLDFPVIMGDAHLGESYGGVLGLPVTFLIDRQGVVVAKIKGESDLGKMETDLRQLLVR